MGLQQKLEREYSRGYQDGQKASNETLVRMARNEGFILGAQETWNIIHAMIPNLEGIGPKTTEKLLKAIQKQAKIEKSKLNS
jgi:hypothetical protein